MKKILTGMLCFATAVCMGAGGMTMFAKANEGNGTEEKTTACSNSHSEEFLLGSWVSYIWQAPEGEKPPTLAEQVKMLADAGLNFNIRASEADEIGDETIGDDIGTLEFWKGVDEVYKANDMYYGFCNHNNDWRCLTKPSYCENDTERGLNRAKEFAPYLDNCIFYMVKDEPSVGAFDHLAEWCKKYVGIKEGVYPWVNLLPSYAGSNAIGDSYYDYLDGWVQAVGAENQEYLSHDYYVFHENSSNMNFFTDVEAMRKVGLKYDLKTHGFPQAQGWNGMRTPTVDEMRWNDYAYLAYGFKGLCYFNWSWWGGEGNDGGLIGKYGEPEDPEKYEQAVALNWELRALEDIIMNVDCLHAYHTRNNIAGVEYLPDNWLINPSAASDLVVSYMRARDNTEPYFMIFNKSFTDGVSTSFTVDKYSGITGLEYFNPNTKQYEEVAIEDGKFSLELRPGEGKYLRIKGDVNLPAELAAPKADLESGCYLGNRTVTLTAGSETDKIYYTLDGRFPEPKEENLYTEPFELTAGDGASDNLLLRAITVRGSSFSELTEKSWLIVNQSNAADFTEFADAEIQGEWIKDGDALQYGIRESVKKVTLKTAVESGAAELLDPEWTAVGNSYYISGWPGFDRKIEYTFTGTGIKANLSGGENTGIVDFYLDNEKVGTFDLSAYEGEKDVLSLSDLENSEHVLMLNFPGYADCKGKVCRVNGFTVVQSQETEPTDPLEVKITLKEAVESGKATLLDPEWTADGASYYIHGWAGFDRKIEYIFTGTGIKVNLSGGENMGFVTFFIDGEELDTVDAAAFFGNKNILLASGLENGEHKLLINFTGYADCRGKKCKINGFAVTTAESEPSENQDVKVTLKEAVESGKAKLLDPEWTLTGSAYYIHGWPGFDRKIEYTFTGTGIVVNVNGGNDCGIVDFYIDGEQKGSCDASKFIRNRDAFAVSGLENKEHVLLINFSGYADCKAKRCQINGFTVTNAASDSSVDTGEVKVSLKAAVESGAATLLDPEWTAEGNSYYIHGWEGFDRKIEYTFVGTGIKVNVSGGENMGIISFYLDGVLQKGIYDASKFTGVQDIFSVMGLENKKHTLLINFTGYAGCRGKKCQINSFTVLTKDSYDFYRSAETFKGDFIASATLNVKNGVAGLFFGSGEKNCVFVSLNASGILTASDKTGCRLWVSLEGIDLSNVAITALFCNGKLTLFINGENIAVLDFAAGECKTGLYAAYGAEVTFLAPKLGAIVSGEIKRTEAVVSFVEPGIVTLDPGTSAEDSVRFFPENIALVLSDGSIVEVAVAWTTDDYDETMPGKYRFIAVITGEIGYANPFEIELFAYGFLCEEVDYTYIDGIIRLAESLDESKYTIATWAVVEEYYKIAVESRADKTNFTNQLTVAGMQLMDKINALVNPSLVWSGLDEAIAELKAVDGSLYTETSAQTATEKLAELNAISRTGLIEQSEIDAAATSAREILNALDMLVNVSEALSEWIERAEEAIASGLYTEESAAALQGLLDRIGALNEREGASLISSIKEEMTAKYYALEEKEPVRPPLDSSSSGSGTEVLATIGCKATVGLSAGMALMTLAAAAVVCKKKK